MISQTIIVRVAAFLGLIAVALGAFGAHYLREILINNGTSAIWQTAVFYQFIHTLALLWLARENDCANQRWIFFFWTAGILLFSGSLYLLAYLGQKWLGALTPWGGASFLLGWIFLLFAKFGK